MRTWPSATATREVTALSETSTIWASPLPSKWVSPAILHPPGSERLGQKVARGGFNVVLTHEGFADQEAARAIAGHFGQILGRIQPAFADDHPVGWHQFGQLARGVEGCFEGIEVAIVDADHVGFQV